MKDLATFKQAIDPVLASCMQEYVTRASARTNDPYLATLYAHAQTLLTAGGKRIRPYIAYLMHASLVEEDESLYPAFASLELFHTFALIHDDIIDRGTTRHGVPCMHQFARTQLGSTHSSAERMAEAQALLVGDMVYAWSRELLTTSVNHEQLRAALALFDEMAEIVVAGQMLDVATVTAETVPMEAIEQKTVLKTAQYTFVCPILLGACLAGKHTEEVQAWAMNMGTALGMAFQLQDDLMDILSSNEQLGKNSMNDIAEGQHTILSVYALAHASIEDAARLRGVFGSSTETIDAAELRAIFERSGTLAYTTERIATALSEAERHLANAPISPTAIPVWQELITRMRSRTS